MGRRRSRSSSSRRTSHRSGGIHQRTGAFSRRSTGLTRRPFGHSRRTGFFFGARSRSLWTRPSHSISKRSSSFTFSRRRTEKVHQPGAYHGCVSQVPDHMGLAILATVLCCWPLGIVAILRAQEARRASDRGDLPSALMLSAQAKRYSLWAVACGCILVAVTIVIVVVVITSNSYYY
ncbi:uncharacterized protein LOC124143958 isoform X1 [Haliotis rufescens]|uniref:uncharacterized protein LOC124143958 isoform X1 n=1 Tax=Haliotis rufescens TaxID=6454 RepID=UPI00201F9794|nr:uncharacterized protein LOC124143958 isoform X1 [Haliotis rufescens]